jgi:hypothetical protein
MKINPHNTESSSKNITLEIFYSQISNKHIQKIQNALATTYGLILNVIIGGELDLLEEAYNSQRDQYNADMLLLHLIKTKKTDMTLWVVKKDKEKTMDEKQDIPTVEEKVDKLLEKHLRAENHG